jgi:hypothetical protein
MLMRKELNLVQGEFVHKKKSENILLSNLRRALPTHIPKAVWDKEIEFSGEVLTKEQVKMLRSYYILHDGTDFPYIQNEQTEKKTEGEYYILLNVPHYIEKNLLDDNKSFSSKEISEIKKYYSFNDKKCCYILNKSVRDIEETQILKILQRKDICMSEVEKYTLAKLFEKLPGIYKENIFYANMVIDVKHSFFFEHPTEHVPGMMILEASRQLVVAVCHEFKNIPVDDVSMVLTIFNANFINYLELHLPIKLKGVITKLEINKAGFLPIIEMDIFIIQTDAINAQIKISGKVTSKRLFSRLRKQLPKESGKSRYFPMPKSTYHILIKQDESVFDQNIKLINLSLSGFCIEIDRPILAKEGLPLFDFIFCFNDVGFAYGICRIVWQIGEGSIYFVGFEIVNISHKQKENLYDAIKRFCYVIEEREIL